MKELKINDNGEDLNVSRWRNDSRGDQKENKSMSKSNSKGLDYSKYKCFIYHKNDHFKKDCPERETKSDQVYMVIASDKDGYKSVGALVVTSLQTTKSQVMYFSWSYHMFLKKEYFETSKLNEIGIV